jgi:hypothetical protein
MQEAIEKRATIENKPPNNKKDHNERNSEAEGNGYFFAKPQTLDQNHRNPDC